MIYEVPEQPSNAYSPIEVIESGRSINRLCLSSERKSYKIREIRGYGEGRFMEMVLLSGKML